MQDWITQYLTLDAHDREQRLSHKLARTLYPTGWGGWPGEVGGCMHKWLALAIRDILTSVREV